jgi:hypothetical protein
MISGALQDFTVLQNFCGNGCRIQDFQKSYPAGPVENGSVAEKPHHAVACTAAHILCSTLSACTVSVCMCACAHALTLGLLCRWTVRKLVQQLSVSLHQWMLHPR